MELLIVSGLSGSGKSVSMNALEDIGYFCMDNIPAWLLPQIVAFSRAGDSQLDRVAISMDVRGCRTRQEVQAALDQLDLQQVPYKVLFLDASDEVLCRRYKETRRRHPISLTENIPTIQAIAKEREILQPLLDRADYVMDTSLFSTAQNKERICDLFVPGGGAKAAMRLNVVSFGFKFGLPGSGCRGRPTWCWTSAACPTPSMCRPSSTRPAWTRKWWTTSWALRKRKSCWPGSSIFWRTPCPSMSRRARAS